MYEITKGVPVPNAVRPNRTRKYPLDKLKVGEMIFIPGKTKNRMTPHLSNVGKQLGVKFTSRLCYMKERLDGWEPADKTDPNAVLGVGVWRVV